MQKPSLYSQRREPIEQIRIQNLHQNRFQKLTRSCQNSCTVNHTIDRLLVRSTARPIFLRQKQMQLSVKTLVPVGQPCGRPPIDRQASFLLVHVVQAICVLPVLLAAAFLARANRLRCSSLLAISNELKHSIFYHFPHNLINANEF